MFFFAFFKSRFSIFFNSRKIPNFTKLRNKSPMEAFSLLKVPVIPVPGMEFASFEDLKSFVQSYADQNDFKLIIQSGSEASGKIQLVCEHFGKPRVSKSTGSVPQNTKKLGCTFSVRGLREKDSDAWKICSCSPQHAGHFIVPGHGCCNTAPPIPMPAPLALPMQTMFSPPTLSQNPLYLPKFSLGTWTATGGSDEELFNSVYESIRAGCRHIDCAYEYKNEAVVGKAINAAMSQLGISRSELVITTKLWNTDHKPRNVEAALRRSMNNLQVSYIDCYLIHFPLAFAPPLNPGDVSDEALYPRSSGHIIYDDTPLIETWRAVECLVTCGLVNRIGLSNTPLAMLHDIYYSSSIRPSIVQIECHPYLQQQQYIEWCHQREICVEAYSPLGGKYDYGEYKGLQVMNDPIIAEIAEKHNLSAVQVIIAWHAQRFNFNYNESLYVLVMKSVHKERIIANIEALSNPYALDNDDIAAINELGKKRVRFNDAPRVFWNTILFED